MKRTINLVGQNTLTVSLPSEFVKKQNIKKGQEVDVEEQGNAILIRTEKRPQFEKKTVDIKEISSISRKYINTLYRRGVDEIEVKYENEKDLAGIKKALANELPNFEIVKKTGNVCLIKSVSELDEKEIDNLIRRTLILLKEMLLEIKISYEKKDRKKLTEINELELINNKLTNLIRRSINRTGYGGKNNVVFFLFIDQIEKAADELRDFSLICGFKSKEIPKILEHMEKQLDLFYDSYYHFDNKKINDFKILSLEVIEKCEKAITKEDPLEFHHLLTFCEIIYNLSTSIIYLNN